MDTFAEFEHHLHETLNHLHDPSYNPPPPVWTAAGCRPDLGIPTLHATVLSAIEELKPRLGAPTNSHAGRLYDILCCRYSQGLTQKEAASLLGLSPRHIRREQQEAVHALALVLWRKSQTDSPAERQESAEPAPLPLPALPAKGEAQWREQIHEEMAAIARTSATGSANIRQTALAAVKLAGMLTSRRRISLAIATISPELEIAVHPSVLRQLIIMGIGEVARYLSTGTITLAVEPQSRSARLVISGQPSSDQNPVVSDLLHEMLAASGVAARLAHLADTVTLSVDLPLAGTGKLTVLVVDDNTDLERLYQRFTADTSFRLVLSARGQGVMEMIQTDRPDVIVLDVMLPDIDGWDLLVNLHEHPDTRAIPVVVHSVIREEELALALGAKVYLPKPARRREFIDALERALNRAPAEETTEPANSAAA